MLFLTLVGLKISFILSFLEFDILAGGVSIVSSSGVVGNHRQSTFFSTPLSDHCVYKVVAL